MAKKIIFAVFLIFLFLPSTGLCEVRYFEKPDDFSDGIIYGVAIMSHKANNEYTGINSGIISVVCFPEHGLQVQFYTKDTIFPDPDRTTESNKHRVSVTFKFDKVKKPLQMTCI